MKGRVRVRVRVRGDGEGDGQSSSQGQDKNQSSGQGQGWVPISSTCESGAHATPTTSPEWPRSEAADLRSRVERAAVGDKGGRTGADTQLGLTPNYPSRAHLHFSCCVAAFPPKGTAPCRSPAPASLQSMTIESSEPEARNRPSGDQRAQLTAPSCPDSVASNRGTLSSCSLALSSTGASAQILIVPSCPAVAKRVPSGCTSTEKIGCPSCETHPGLAISTMASPAVVRAGDGLEGVLPADAGSGGGIR